jgi:hypothetical protein
MTDPSAPESRRKRFGLDFATGAAIVLGALAVVVSLGSMLVAMDANRIADQANRPRVSVVSHGLYFDLVRAVDAPCWEGHAGRGAWPANSAFVVEVINDGPQAVSLRGISSEPVEASIPDVNVWVVADPVESKQALDEIDPSGQIDYFVGRLRLEPWPLRIESGDAAIVVVHVDQLVVVNEPTDARTFQNAVEGIEWPLRMHLLVGATDSIEVSEPLPRPWEMARSAGESPVPMTTFPDCGSPTG